MKNSSWKQVLIRFLLIVVAMAGPVAFPLSQMGTTSLHDLSKILVLPALAILVVAWGALRVGGQREIASDLLRGALGGAVATLALEAFRYTGFRLGFMPGNLPELMGVLLLDQFALGPTTLSTVAGFAYHFWVGASFGIIYALLAARRSPGWAVPYGLSIGLGFLVSPVVQALGVGLFGKDFGWHFAATVLAAHAAFGMALGRLVAFQLQAQRLNSHPQTKVSPIKAV